MLGHGRSARASKVHTHSAMICWVAYDRLGGMAADLGLQAEQAQWSATAANIHAEIFARETIFTVIAVAMMLAISEPLHPFISTEDLIWIRDYHLAPLTALLCDRGIKNPICVFLHIPWPAPEVILTLPRCTALLQSMLACNLIGFQTPNDAERFRDCLRRTCLVWTSGCKIVVRSLSIDLEGFSPRAKNAIAKPRLRDLQTPLTAQKLVVGGDRLDYTKGIPQRLAGYHRFSKNNPDRIA